MNLLVFILGFDVVQNELILDKCFLSPVNRKQIYSKENHGTDFPHFERGICKNAYSDWVCTAVMSNDVMKDLRG